MGGTGVDSRRLEPASELGRFCRPTVGGANGSQLSIVTVGGPTFFFFSEQRVGLVARPEKGAENRNKQKQLKLSR